MLSLIYPVLKPCSDNVYLAHSIQSFQELLLVALDHTKSLRRYLFQSMHTH